MTVKVGDLVFKETEDFFFVGRIVSVFRMLEGNLCCVVESDNKEIFISPIHHLKPLSEFKPREK